MPESDSVHRFDASASWKGDGAGSGEVRVSGGRVAVPIAGDTRLGGSGGKVNPEELLLSAIGACFANTWAIFLAKLQVPYETPALEVAGDLGADPAGGFRMQKVVVRAHVPAALLAADRAKIEKTLALAEKYCIISKVARAAMPLAVEIVEVGSGLKSP
jgi:organic hydroperoxide reductase OsmC/OhrA